MQEKFIEKADAFKANKGWFHRFLRRKKKFRKRKSWKKLLGEDNIIKIIKPSDRHVS